MFWTAAAFVVSLVLTYTLYQVPESEGRSPAGLDEFDVPTAESGREIPVVFGTRDIKSANVVWYGHLRVTPIKKKGGKKG